MSKEKSANWIPIIAHINPAFDIGLQAAISNETVSVVSPYSKYENWDQVIFRKLMYQLIFFLIFYIGKVLEMLFNNKLLVIISSY